MDSRVFVNVQDFANILSCLHYYSIREGNGCSESHWLNRNEALNLIFNLPPEYTITVNYGKWEHDGGDEWHCPICGNVIHTEGSWEKPTYKYCSECGARMEIEND